MAKPKLREKAIKLRTEEELSYSQIKEKLGVSKSTLSYWLRDYPLSDERIKELKEKGKKRSAKAIEKFRKTMRKKREERLEKVYKKQKEKILPLAKRDLFIAGLFLYVGEGTKTKKYSVAIANTDPAVIKLFIRWLKEFFEVPKEKFKVQLHLYKDMEPEEEIEYWKNKLDLPSKQFNKPYIKESSSKDINYKGRFKHGTCEVKVGGREITEEIKMSIKVFQDHFN